MRNLLAMLSILAVFGFSGSALAEEASGKIQAVDINPIGLGGEASDAVVLDAKVHL